MKYCPQCGAQLPDDATFCAQCGTPLAAPQAPVNQPAPAAPQPKKKNLGLIAGLVLAVALIVAAVILVPKFLKNRPAADGAETIEPQQEFSGSVPAASPLIPAGETVPDDGFQGLGKEDEDTDDIFQSLDELSQDEYIAYKKALLERSEAQLEEELAKGAAADPAVVKELREGIESLRKGLEETP